MKVLIIVLVVVVVLFRLGRVQGQAAATPMLPAAGDEVKPAPVTAASASPSSTNLSSPRRAS